MSPLRSRAPPIPPPPPRSLPGLAHAREADPTGHMPPSRSEHRPSCRIPPCHLPTPSPRTHYPQADMSPLRSRAPPIPPPPPRSLPGLAHAREADPTGHMPPSRSEHRPSCRIPPCHLPTPSPRTHYPQADMSPLRSRAPPIPPPPPRSLPGLAHAREADPTGHMPPSRSEHRPSCRIPPCHLPTPSPRTHYPQADMSPLRSRAPPMPPPPP